MKNDLECLLEFALKHAAKQPIRKRARLYRGLARACGDPHEQRQLADLAEGAAKGRMNCAAGSSSVLFRKRKQTGSGKAGDEGGKGRRKNAECRMGKRANEPLGVTGLSVRHPIPPVEAIPAGMRADFRPRSRPMISLDGAKAWLDLNEDEVVGLVEEGELEGWNIGTGGRRVVRLLCRAIERYLRYQRRRRKRPPAFTFEELVAQMLPHERPVLDGKELQRVFNCSSTHVIRLITANQLKPNPGSFWRAGPNGSPVVTRESVVGVLRRRRIGWEGGKCEFPPSLGSFGATRRSAECRVRSEGELKINKPRAGAF